MKQILNLLNASRLNNIANIVLNNQIRNYAAKKPAKLTEAQMQLQKHTAELGFKEKTSIKGTLFEFHDVETSVKYMKSQAFKEAYGDKLIWEWYIRNFKGGRPKSYTRKQCIINGRYIIGNPCPICRDPYLVVSYKNLDLLNHFLNPTTGLLYSTDKTNVCRKQHENLEIAFQKACDHGFLDHYIPHREYDYSLYFPSLKYEANANATSVQSDSNLDKKSSVLLGIILGANRKQVNHIYTDLKEEDIHFESK